MAIDRQDVPIADQIGDQKRLESLLLDDADRKQTISVDEIKNFANRKTGYSGTLIILSLLAILFLLVVGYYYLKTISLSQSPVEQVVFYTSPRQPIPARQKTEPATTEVTIVTKGVELEKEAPEVVPTVDNVIPLFTVNVGPFIRETELQQAISWLREIGFQAQKKLGRGQVVMIRLLEGIYPAEEAQVHLVALKQVVDSAFLMPDGDNLAVYAGSFREDSQARLLRDELAQRMIRVSLVDSEVTMNGTMLTVLQADRKTAGEVAAHISSLGLNTHIVEKK